MTPRRTTTPTPEDTGSGYHSAGERAASAWIRQRLEEIIAAGTGAAAVPGADDPRAAVAAGDGEAVRGG